MLLADSSAWVWALARRINLGDASGDDIVSCPPVHQEILRGARDDEDFGLLQQALAFGVTLDDPLPLARFEDAARIYIACRARGFTIRSSHDCLIAACAMAHDIAVLHDDHDFEHIARVVPLKTVRL